MEGNVGEARPVTTTLLPVPATRAGQAHVAFWLAGRTHPPSTQRLAEFIEHVRATEAEARDATGLPFDVDEFVRFHTNERGYIRMSGDDLAYALRSEMRAALAAAPQADE